MAPQDTAGRIPKDGLLASISVLLVPAVLGVLLRLFIIIRVQKQRISLDDYLLIVALGFLLASIIIMYAKVIDGMYLTWAIELGMTNVTIPTDIVEVGYKFHLYSDVCLLISWCSFSAVKLSFLFFFKKLIDRMRVWQIYWRMVFAYTVCVLIYGALVFFVSCPFFNSPKENACNVGKKKDQIVQESISLAVLDVVGDALILAIPINVIWKIQVRWGQKIFLSFSLCLTVIMIILSIIRVCGLVYHDLVDTVWETYWQFLSAEIGVFLASAVSFRSLFVSRNRSNASPNYSVKRLFKDSFHSPKRRNTMSVSDSWLDSPESEMKSLPKHVFIGDGNYMSSPTTVGASNVDLESNWMVEATEVLLRPSPAIVKQSRDRTALHENV
ncbi:uncharacterized protein N7503_009364 [Penicillium pulvis]|uniref:uncharacterized protein n=1 Tax=Penicillium pulvis TaxID=1562058 RepID=UPI0025497FFB|nr:uncharacterized protein N7503_009364 [Penicillium pulvis]KAJ5793386.1 hypothetical protein N7503_009364 [Penicillium pulvis]